VTKRSAFPEIGSLARFVTFATVIGGAGSLAGGCVPREGSASVGGGRPGSESHPSVDAARELDQEGVRSFRAGRYGDAIEYFRAAYRLGGPSSELWNIVRCREGLDDAEGAAGAIEDYLASKDVTPRDRADAEREAQGLRLRPSMLTVTTSPSGASMAVDGKAIAGQTPLSVEVRAGTHSLVVRREGYSPMTEHVEARFGRAVIVSLDLDRGGK
jgi:hypothetical protein